MPTYDLDITKPQRAEKKGGWGCAFGGWAVFLLVAAAALFIGYRVWFYYQKIKTGQLVDLPQFENRLTSVSNGGAAASAASSARTDVELDTAASQGPADAKLVVVEFADFQCPYSKEEALVVRSLMQKYGDKVRFEYRDYPLSEIHPYAMQSAVAARCAQEQGKFWAYHDKLFVNQPSLSDQMLTQYAAEVGMDTKQFEHCFTSQLYRPKVEADRATAQRLGITGTPTFFFNGSRVDGAVPIDVFENLIQKMIK